MTMVECLADVAQGDMLRWTDSAGNAQHGTVWADPDGREGHVMVAWHEMGGELLPLAFAIDGGVWKVGR